MSQVEIKEPNILIDQLPINNVWTKLRRYTPEAIFFSILFFMILIRYKFTGGYFYKLIWDEGFYFGIVKLGYFFDNNVETMNNVVFFPLYPLLCKILLTVLPFLSEQQSMFLVSWLASYFAIKFLFNIAFHYNGYYGALCSTLLFVLSPFSFFMFQGYTEGVFFALVFAFYYYMVIKEHEITPLVVIGLASATRLYGILLIPVYIFHMLYYNKISFTRLVLLLPIGVSGLALFCIYLYFNFGDAFLFVYNQLAWVQKIINDFRSLITLKQITLDLGNLDFRSLRFFISLFFVIATFITISSTSMSKTMRFFSALYLVFFFFIYNPETVTSMGRYLTFLFPVFISAGAYFAKNNFESVLRKKLQFAFICLLLFSIAMNFYIMYCEVNVFVG